MVEISSERESPVVLVTIAKEVSSMLIESSSVPKKKRKGHRPSSSMLKKRQNRTFARE